MGPRGWGPEGVGAPEGWGPEGWGPEGWGPQRVGAPKGEGPQRVGAQRVGAQRVGAQRVGAQRVGAQRVGAQRVGAQNFALFFPLPPQLFILFSLSFGLFVEFWWCLKRRDPQVCTFGVLGLSCASPGGPVWWGRRGFTRQPESHSRDAFSHAR